MTSAIEAAAFCMYQVHIRNAVGTRAYIRDRDGKVIGEETFEQAALRRWNAAPQATRDEFMEYAKAAEPVFRAANEGACAA